MSNQQPYPSYDGHDPRDGLQAPHAQEPYTQTWEGQTWDTQHQPVHEPYRQQDPAPAAADTAYLSPQNGAYPMPQEPQASYDPHAGGPAGYDPHAGGPGGYGYGSPRAAYEPAPPAHEPAPETYRPPSAQAPAPPAGYGPATGGYAASAAYEPAHAAAPAAPSPHSGTGTGTGTGTAPYSPPTTMGHARLTDAQRARAEGRSPIIAPGMQPAALTAVLALLLAGAAAVGPYALVVPLVLLQAVTAAGWFRLNGMWPARQGIALAFLGGVTADIALLAVDAAHAPAAIIGTLGVWVLLTLVLQLRNQAPADERMYGLTATVTSAALAVIAAGHLAAASEAVIVGGIAVAVAVPARALPLPGVVSVVVALLAAAGAGIAAGAVTDVGAQGALLGLAAGVCALIGLRVASYDYPSRFVHMTAGVALPLAAAAPAVYLIGRVVA
ncbi:hypothetical protein [Streptomyces flavidovirens]|uniref:hypothetical protein n=1 Tax=Streptomyces flavidovirens TaxID=67298 RepID=UPI00042435ED|nr:hypothetical protein [Streptomyces flavidovirens]